MTNKESAMKLWSDITDSLNKLSDKAFSIADKKSIDAATKNIESLLKTADEAMSEIFESDSVKNALKSITDILDSIEDSFPEGERANVANNLNVIKNEVKKTHAENSGSENTLSLLSSLSDLINII